MQNVSISKKKFANILWFLCCSSKKGAAFPSDFLFYAQNWTFSLRQKFPVWITFRSTTFLCAFCALNKRTSRFRSLEVMHVCSVHTWLHKQSSKRSHFSMETSIIMDKTFIFHCTYWLLPLSEISTFSHKPRLTCQFDFFFAGLRKVYPYYFTFTTFTKGRWVGEKILDVFAREFRAHPAEEYERCIKAGTLTVNYEKVPIDYKLKHNDLLANVVHR